MCIDEPYNIYGDYNSLRAQNLFITYELCSLEKQETCKSDKEISKAIEFSYLLILENK